MSAVAEIPGISTLVGSPNEVQARLKKSHAERVLVMAFDGIEPDSVRTLSENLANVASSMLEVLLQRQERQAIERLAELLVPRTPASPHLLKEAAMQIRSRKAVLESGDWLTAAEVAQLAGLSSRNPSAQPNKWKKQGLIFAISHGGVDYFPGYGLDRNADFRPAKGLASIIECFGGHKDSWGMAYWFRSENSFLGGQRPQDVLASDAERVLAAALDEVQEIAHG